MAEVAGVAGVSVRMVARAFRRDAALVRVVLKNDERAPLTGSALSTAG